MKIVTKLTLVACTLFVLGAVSGLIFLYLAERNAELAEQGESGGEIGRGVFELTLLSRDTALLQGSERPIVQWGLVNSGLAEIGRAHV